METEKIFLAATAVAISLIAVKYALFQEHQGFYVLYIVGEDGTFESLREDIEVGKPYYFKVFIENKLGYREEFKVKLFVYNEFIASASRIVESGDCKAIYFPIQFKDTGSYWLHIVCTPSSNPDSEKKLSVRVNVKD